MARYRQLKPLLREALGAPDWEARLMDFDAQPPIQLVNPLLSFLLDAGEFKWRAVLALGSTAARLADANMEDGRVLMRRLMWSLSEESGSLGWGAPEAMAAIVAAHPRLGAEFHRILCSYIHDSEREGLYLDHAPLRAGAYWGVGHVATVRPELVAMAAPDLLLALDEATGAVRGGSESDGVSKSLAASIAGNAAWTLGLLREQEASPRLRALREEQTIVELFRNKRLERLTLGEVCAEALERLT
jgi:hypothetical protein